MKEVVKEQQAAAQGRPRLSHKGRLMALIALVLAVSLCCVLAFAGCTKGSLDKETPDSFGFLTEECPDDGSLPTDHTASENFAYLNYRLQQRTSYAVDSHTDVSTNTLGIGVGQDVDCTKSYKDGIMITTLISISSNETFAPSKAMQRFFGENNIVIRGPVSDDPDVWAACVDDVSQMEWDDGEPDAIYTYEDYYEVYGIPSTYISDFIINEETIEEETAVSYDSSTGLYSFSLTLNDKSVYYYLNNMRTMGNLKTNPSFKDIEFTFYFTEDWSVEYYTLYESYDTYVSILTADCVGETQVNFSYDEEDIDISAYDSYFINYEEASATTPEETELTATEYFTEGFSDLLSGEQNVVSIEARIGEATLSGDLYIELTEELSLECIKAELGDLRVWYLEDLIYLSYGDDFTASMSPDELLGLFSSDDSGSSGLSVDTMTLLMGLIGGDLVTGSSGATLTSSLSLGSLAVGLVFEFDVDGDDIAWSEVLVTLSVEGIDVEITVTPGDEDAVFTEIDTENAVDLCPYIEDIIAVVQQKDYTVGIAYAEESLDLEICGSVRVCTEDALALQGEIDISYAGIAVPVSFTYVDSVFYLDVCGLKLSVTADELQTAIETVLALADLDLSAASSSLSADVDIASVITALLTLDYGGIIQGLSITEETLSLSVDVDALIYALTGIETDLRTLEASYTLGAGFTAVLTEVTFTFGASDADSAVAAPENADEYVTLETLEEYGEIIVAIANADDIAFSLEFVMEQADGTDVDVSLSGEIWLDGNDVCVLVEIVLGGDADNPFLFYYDTDDGLILAYAGNMLSVSADDVALLIDEIETFVALYSDSVSAESAGTVDSAEILSLLNSLDLASILESLDLSAQDGATVFSVKIAQLLDSGIEIALASVGDSGLSLYLNESVTSGDITVSVVALSVSVAENERASADSFDGYEDSGNVLDYVLRSYSALAGSEYLSAVVSYEEDGLTVDASAALQFDGSGESVSLNMAAEAVIVSGSDSYYVKAYVAGEDIYLYLSLVGFDSSGFYEEYVSESEDLNPLRITCTVSGLAAAGSDLMPLLSAFLSDGSDLADRCIDFAADILAAVQDTLTADLIGTKSLAEWAELLTEIVAEALPSAEEETETDSSESLAEESAEGTASMELSVDLENLALTCVSGGLSVSVSKGSSVYETEEGTEDISAPAEAEEYEDCDPLLLLCGALTESITHEETVAGDDGTESTSNVLNDSYYIDGTVTMSILSLYNVNITVALSVGIDEDGDIAVSIHLEIPYVLLVINASTVTNITVADGMVYVQRTASGSTSYRAMTGSAFLADIMDQLVYALNLSDTIVSMIDTDSDSEDTEETEDSVTDVGSYITSISSTCEGSAAGGTWTIGVGLSDLTGGVLESLDVTVKADEGGLLSGLEASTTLYSVIGITASLTYENAGDGTLPEDIEDVTEDVSAYAQYLSGVDWDSVDGYVEFTMGELSFIVEGETVETQTVAYDADGELLTAADYPDASEYDNEGYTYSWGEIDGTSVTAVATPRTYTVLIYSEYEIDGYDYAEIAEDGSYVYELEYTYGTSMALTTGLAYHDSGYARQVTGYTDADGNAVSVVEGITDTATVYAVWEEISFMVQYSVFGTVLDDYTLENLSYGDEIAFAGSAELDGYTFLGWGTESGVADDVSTLTAALLGDSDTVTLYAWYAVTVTYCSDYAVEGFEEDSDGSYCLEYTATGTQAEDFAAIDITAIDGFAFLGWYRWSDESWTLTTSVAGLDGEEVWALYVGGMTVEVSFSTARSFITYRITATVTYSYSMENGDVSKQIADWLGLDATVTAEIVFTRSYSSETKTGTGSDGTVTLTSSAASGSTGTYVLTVTASFYSDTETGIATVTVTQEGSF